MNESTAISRFSKGNSPFRKVVLSEATIRFIILGIFLVVLSLIFSSRNANFTSGNNLANILGNASVIGIVSLGQLLVIISGGFDLSVSGTVPLGGVVFAIILNKGWSVPAALLAAVAIAGIFGLANGILVGFVKISPLIATLGTWYISAGFALTLSDGVQIPFDDRVDGILSARTVFGVNNQIWIFLGISLIVTFLLRFTVFGRSLYALGGNREAARLAGIPVSAMTVSVYVISAFMGGLAGAILASQLLTGSGTAGINSALQSIAAVVLGGAALTGGVGFVAGTLVGVIILGALSNGMSMLGIPAFFQTMATGIVLLLAVILSQFRKRGSFRKSEQVSSSKSQPQHPTN